MIRNFTDQNKCNKLKINCISVNKIKLGYAQQFNFEYKS